MASADVVLTAPDVSAVPSAFEISAAAEIMPLAITATFDGSGAPGSTYLPTIEFVAPGGQVVARCPAGTTVAAGGAAEVSWFPGGRLTAAAAAGLPTTESFYLNSHTGPVTSTTVLRAGVSYLVSVQGTYSAWNEVLNVGTPEADAQFPPGSQPGRVSTEVGVDADTIFAWPSDHPHVAGHDTALEMDLGSGYAHVEPFGGPYTVPATDHFYSYTLLGQGAQLTVRTNDIGLADDYGLLKVTIYAIPVGGVGSVTSVASADSSLTVTSPTSTPTIKVASLDVLATNEPPLAAWSNNAQRITNVADGVAAQDAATVHQLSTAPGAGTFLQLADTLLVAAQATIDLLTISQAFTHLWLVVVGATNGAVTASPLLLRFNNDAGANYSWAEVFGNATPSAGGGGALLTTSATVGSLPGTTGPASAAGDFQVWVPNYTGTVFHKGAASVGGRRDATTLAGIQAQSYRAAWLNTAAISRITLSLATGSFVAGSRATLYGTL